MNERPSLRGAAGLIAAVGVLYVVGLVGRGPAIDPARETLAFAQSIASPRVIASGLGYIAAMVLHALACVRIAAATRDAAPRAAELGAALSIASLVLTSAVVGALVFAFPAIARSYLGGNAAAADIFTMAAGPLFLGSVMLEGLLITLGSALLGRAMTRAGAPSWTGAAYGVAAMLYSTPVPGFAAELIGSGLLAVCAVGLLRARDA